MEKLPHTNRFTSLYLDDPQAKFREPKALSPKSSTKIPRKLRKSRNFEDDNPSDSISESPQLVPKQQKKKRRVRPAPTASRHSGFSITRARFAGSQRIRSKQNNKKEIPKKRPSRRTAVRNFRKYQRFLRKFQNLLFASPEEPSLKGPPSCHEHPASEPPTTKCEENPSWIPLKSTIEDTVDPKNECIGFYVHRFADLVMKGELPVILTMANHVYCARNFVPIRVPHTGAQYRTRAPL